MIHRLAKRLTELLFGLFFVTLFVPLKLRVYEPVLFSSGDFNPYTSFFIYFSDVFFVLFFVFAILDFLMHKRKLTIPRSMLLFWLMFLILGQVTVFFSPDRTLSFLFLLRWCEMFIVYIALINSYIRLDRLAAILVYGLVAESILAIVQYLLGHSAGLAWLGEPFLALGTPGVATVTFLHQAFLRGYGTFLHPNILAGFLLFGFYILFRMERLPARNWMGKFFIEHQRGILGSVLFFGLLVTFSRSALIAFLIASGIYFFHFRKKIHSTKIVVYSSIAFFLLVAGNISYVLMQRFSFSDIAALQFRMENLMSGFRLFFDHIFGTSLGGSTLLLQSVTPEKLSPWQYQPSHNFFLFVANELGIEGLILFCVAGYLLLKKAYLQRKKHALLFASLCSMIFVSLFDHYFFTSYEGGVLFVLILASCSLELFEHRTVDEATAVSV